MTPDTLTSAQASLLAPGGVATGVFLPAHAAYNLGIMTPLALGCGDAGDVGDEHNAQHKTFGNPSGMAVS